MRAVPQRRSTLMVVALSVLASVALLTAVPVFADVPTGAQAAVMGVMFLFMFLVFAVFYIYGALATQTIAKKPTPRTAGWLGSPLPILSCGRISPRNPSGGASFASSPSWGSYL